MSEVVRLILGRRVNVFPSASVEIQNPRIYLPPILKQSVFFSSLQNFESDLILGNIKFGICSHFGSRRR